ncbi:putative nuclease HARBI1 [Trichomycterus rosablanca]|uniref:putative nuclease HARBI1 n=1 Tax=Trichomycterus rosablanca TaxID=2290929 RepID=UPI002F353852
MAYAGAVWLAVQNDLYRSGIRTPKAPKPPQNKPDLNPPDTINTNTGIDFLNRFDDYFLLQCFHFTRPCLNFITDYIQTRVKKEVFKPTNDSTSIESQTLATLYFYAHGSLPRRITDMLGMEPTETTDAVNLVSRVLEDMCSDFITFPASFDDRMGVAQGFERITCIPNVVGLLCWLHVKVTPSQAEKDFFLNTLGYYSVMVQVICDVDGNLLSVEQCYPGGTVEQQVWEGSSIFQKFDTYQHGETWILSSQSLRKSKHVLTSVEVSQIKTDAATRFNATHAQVLNLIPQVLGCLKTRFQCLNNLGSVKANALKPVARIVTACCVLHNISKKFSVPLPGDLVLEPEHPVPAARQQVKENCVDERKEDMIETCFGNSRDEQKEEGFKIDS